MGPMELFLDDILSNARSGNFEASHLLCVFQDVKVSSHRRDGNRRAHYPTILGSSVWPQPLSKAIKAPTCVTEPSNLAIICSAGAFLQE